MQKEASESPLRAKEFWIGLSSWVIQDGNYTEFATGEVRQFALEFGYKHTRRLQPSSARARSCSYTGRTTTYEVEAEVLVAASDYMEGPFVLNTDLMIYCGWMVLDTLEPPVAGDWLSGEVTLEIDPFMWMDGHAHQRGMPPLIYTWRIEEIQKSSTPLITVSYGDPRYGRGPNEGPRKVHDLTRESWRTVESTDAGSDEGPYRLRCRLEDEAPAASMSQSGTPSPYGPLTD